MNMRGQASFELLFVLIAIVVISSAMFVSGVSSFNEVSVLSFVHNSFNEYKVKENYDGRINYLDVYPSGEQGVEIVLNTSKELSGFEKYSNNIEQDINTETRYSIVSWK